MKWGRWWRAEFLSARDLVRRSLIILLLFAVVQLAGLREFTSILNGTMGSVALGWQLSAFLGLSYLVLYFAVVVLVPILWIAAALLAVWDGLGFRIWKRPHIRDGSSGSIPERLNLH